jgi:tetratricopeptide (TPR) repeat protein
VGTTSDKTAPFDSSGDDAFAPTKPSAAEATQGAPLDAGTRVGRYTLVERIGSGGMGVVYRARDAELDRDVAIKVLGQTSQAGQERLLAEARAMAKVRHPSLVPVFDVGTTVDNRVFFVMPLVGEGNLSDWLRQKRRTWEQIVERFCRAGRGLAAAHDAGIVHRDFKPSNVLVDGDDVLVADMGIATMDASAPTTTVEGTLAYMAPEQISGQNIDARADQYSFCVALWEGLYGQRPSEADTLTKRPLPDGARRVPAGSGGIPGWLAAAVARGFSPPRDERWPSMDALLDHLEKRGAHPRRGMIIAAGLIVVTLGIAGGAWMITRDAQAPTCALPEGRVAGVWDTDIKAKLLAAFETVDPNIAAETTAKVASALDAYVSEWKHMHVDACRAAHVTRVDPLDVLDRRMTCLDRRLALLRTLTSSLADSREEKLMRRGEQLVHSLPRVADCADRKQLMSVVAPPADPVARARLAEIEAELDAITALKWRGEHIEQLRRAEAALSKARELGDAPTLARSLAVLSKAQWDNGKEDEKTTRELAHVAAGAGMAELEATAWLDLLTRLTNQQTSFDEARTLEAAAHAAVLRAGSPDALRFRELFMGAVRASNSGEYKVARERFEQAIPLATKPELRAEIEMNLAKLTMMIDGPSAALKGARTAVASFEGHFGRDNAMIIDPLLFLAQVLRQTGALEEARSTARRALSLQDRYVAADSSDRAITLQTLGGVEGELGRTDEAIKLISDAADIFEKANDVVRHALALDSLADQFMVSDNIAKARPLHERALQEVAGAMSKDWVYYARLELNFAESLVKAGACGEATPLLEHAATVLQKEQPSYVGDVHWLRAQCLQRARKHAAALRELERAEAICRTGDCGSAADARWALGKLLLERGDDDARANALIDEARSQWDSSGLKHRVQEVDSWRASH